MSWRPDPEIDDLFEDERERRLAHTLRSVQSPEVTADPAFRSHLRRQLMEEAWRVAEPRMSWWQRLWAPQRAAWAMAGVGAVLLAVVVYSLSGPAGDRTVVIRSNVDNTVPVAAVQPVELTFSQPMNRQTVEQALEIKPATAVSYQWTSDTQVTIVPASGGFAPNTQYTVSLAPNVAQTQQGKAVPASTPAVFTVKPTPSPAPSPSPSPSPPPTLRVTVLGNASDARPAWNYQGRIAAIGPAGELELFGIEGGAPEVLVPSGVTAFALSGPQVAYVRAGQVFAGGRQVTAATPAAPAIAVGFAGQNPVYTSAGTAVDAQGRAVKLAVTATAAWFSPDGQRLAYQAADKSLHELDLGTGKDTVWAAAATTFLNWSPDSSRVLYSTPDAVYTADPTGQAAARLGALPAAVAADWTAAGPIVVEARGELHRLNPDGTGDTVIDSPVTAPAFAVSPSNGSIAFVGGGRLAVAQPPLAGAAVTVDTAAPVVGAFEKARLAGDQAAASALVATAARTVAPAPAGIQRWFTVAALPAADGVHETIRVVLADKTGRDTSQLDESLLVAAGPGGKPVIASVTDSAPRPYSAGPEVLGVTVTASAISVEFDSDLTAASVPGAIKLIDASGKTITATTTLNGRTATLAPTPALAPGVYRVSVTRELFDANHRPAVAEFDLDIPAAP